RFSNNADNGVANMPHHATGKCRTGWNDARLARVDDGDARQLADAVGREVGLAPYRHHPGDRARRFQIDANDTREGMGRRDHITLQRVRHMIVADIFPAPGEEANVLQPVQRLTLITLAQLLTAMPRCGRDTGQGRQAWQDVPPSDESSPNDLTRAPVLTFQNVL